MSHPDDADLQPVYHPVTGEFQGYVSGHRAKCYSTRPGVCNGGCGISSMLGCGRTAEGPTRAEPGYGVLRVSPDVILQMTRLDGSRVIRAEGMPADARVVRASYDVLAHQFVLVVESASLPRVEDGSLPPEIDVRFHTMTLAGAVADMEQRAALCCRDSCSGCPKQEGGCCRG